MNKKSRKIVFNVVAIALLVIGFVWVCSRFVHLGRVEYTDNAQVRQHIVPVNSRLQGFIKKIYFEEYEPVHKGDTLLLIEDAEFRLRVAQAEADYQNAQAGRSAMGTAVSTAHNNLAVSDAGIEEVEVLLKNAEKDYERYKKLLSEEAVTQQQYDGVKTNYEALKAKYETLVSIVDEAETWVVANYKETQTAHIAKGMPVDMTIDAIPGVVYKGRVQSISKATGAQYSLVPQDNSAGNFVKVEQRIPVRIVFSEENSPEDMDKLRAGLNVECEVKYRDHDSAR